jgi:hypothetical protein
MGGSGTPNPTSPHDKGHHIRIGHETIAAQLTRISCGPKDMGHGSGTEAFGLDEIEVQRPFKICEKTEPLAQGYGVSQKPEFIDEARLDQASSKADTAMGNQVLSGLSFEFPDPSS